MKVCDSGIMLINAQQGVEVGTEIHGRYAEERNFPVVLAVNQLETEKASLASAIDSIHQAFGSKAVVFQYPVNPGLRHR